MFDNEDIVYRKKEVNNKMKNKSMLTEQIEITLDKRSKVNEMMCMQLLKPTSNIEEHNLQTRKVKSEVPYAYINIGSTSNKERTESVSYTKLDKHSDGLDTFNFDRSERYLARLNTQLLEAVEHGDAGEAERLIIEGANPNATCRLGHDSACHIAALVGGDSLSILLKYGADMNRSAKVGRTPIHMAAWAGNVVQLAMLLGLPEEIQHKIENGFIAKDVEEEIKRLNCQTKPIANVKTNIGIISVLPKTWKDCVEHKCKDLKLPFVEETWTPLHVASSCAQHHCVRLLLAAGADPNNKDIMSQTPLDVAGSAFYREQDILKEKEVIKALINAGAKFHDVLPLNYINSPLHTAIELEYLSVAEIILEAGAGVRFTQFNNEGDTPLHICMRKKLTDLQNILKYYTDDGTVAFDLIDKHGFTVLHVAVKDEWVPGVCIALENGADITVQAKNGETPIHTAAELGNIDILNEMLCSNIRNQILDYKNRKGETALFKAIKHGHLHCVEFMLKNGASVHIKLPGNHNVLHVAAKYGHSQILQILLINNNVINSDMINEQTTLEHEGFGPIHFAIMYKNAECVKLLLKNKADVFLKVLKDYRPYNASTPLHIAAVRKHLEIAKIILRHDKRTLKELDSCNWTPLHAASYYGSRDVVLLLLREGADMTLQTKGPDKFKKTSVDLIMNNLRKPTQFMEDVFDSYINNDLLHLTNSLVTVDYRILTSNAGPAEQMKVVEAILETGNRFGQRRLLIHPLVESFLYFNWVYLLPFFYVMIGLYGLYVLSLNIFITSFYFYKDMKDVPPIWLNPFLWKIFIYLTGTLIFAQELCYINFASKTYFARLESWIKLTGVTLGVILPIIFSNWPENIWPRHVTTVALLLSWTEMMFMLSRFPKWGYYVLMFGKVLTKLLKILLTFVFLVIGFALSFMIQFHSQAPFDDPWAAFVKTMVMMTSEFDYLDLFDDNHKKNIAASLVIVRLIFLLFLILAGIVLMNLMVGVAVNDLHNLEIHGNIRRLEKQVEFLSSLEAVVYNELLRRNLPKCLRMRRKTINKVTISVADHKSLPFYLRDALFEKAKIRENEQATKIEDQVNCETLKNKLDEIHKALKKSKSLSNTKHNIHDNEGVDKNDSIYTVDKDFIQKDVVDELKARMGLISMEMEAINAILSKLDKHN